MMLVYVVWVSMCIGAPLLALYILTDKDVFLDWGVVIALPWMVVVLGFYFISGLFSGFADWWILYLPKMFVPSIVFVCLFAFRSAKGGGGVATVASVLGTAIVICVLVWARSMSNAMASQSAAFGSIVEFVKSAKIDQEPSNKPILQQPFIAFDEKGVPLSRHFPREVFFVADEPKSVKSVVLVQRTSTLIHSYNIGADYQWVFTVCVFAWPSKDLTAKAVFSGSTPGDRTGSPGGASIYGSEPWDDLTKYLAGLAQQKP